MISPLASIHPSAKIGNDVTIEPFAVIYADVVIGDGSWIGPHAIIFDGARIGKECRIFPGAVISAIPQDLKFKGEVTTAEIGDHTTIRECVTVNRGTTDKNKTVIGSNCLLMAYAHVAHDCMLGNNIILANSVNLAGHVTIDDYAILEGMVAVAQFLRIGAHSFIAGGTLVRKNVPPFTKAAREPISYAGVNSVGLRRRGYSDDSITLIQEIYRILFLKGYSVNKAMSAIETELEASPLRDEIIQFVKDSPKGIMRGFTEGQEEE
ncbi:MAG: acyl-ACP--UDP-N-acetylglucosamine O-acyltransferase [Bacteroidota bacterium]